MVFLKVVPEQMEILEMKFLTSNGGTTPNVNQDWTSGTRALTVDRSISHIGQLARWRGSKNKTLDRNTWRFFRGYEPIRPGTGRILQC